MKALIVVLLLACASGAWATDRGDFMGATRVRIRDAKGAEALDVETDGPIPLANLVPGTYEIHVGGDAKDATQRVTVRAGAQSHVIFRWPDVASR